MGPGGLAPVGRPIGHDRGVDTPERLIPLSGAFNFRDLGGYPSRHGGTTRWHLLFRSDTIHELTEADVGLLSSMGLATIIDLRTPTELARTGRGPLGGLPIGFHHFSVLAESGGEAMAAPAPAGEELSERYLWYLENGAQALADALSVLGEPESYPCVFHCAAGKDRTGVLAALVLDLVGVDAEVIVSDYLLTAERMPLIMGRYRSDPALAERMATVPASRFAVEAATMEQFLTGLHDQFGGARAWAVDAGVPAATLDRIASILVDRPD